MKLDAEELHRLSEHLDDLIEATAAERSSRLALIGQTAPETAHRLAELLARQAAVETGDFMATLPKFSIEESFTTATRSGERVGPYEVLQELGQGGMSTVWLARRVDGALSRTVALKLPYAGAHGRQLTERFARERDILASLSHSNIARLYDAGCFLMSSREGGLRGDYREPNPELNFHTFVTSLLSRAYGVAITQPPGPAVPPRIETGPLSTETNDTDEGG